MTELILAGAGVLLLIIITAVVFRKSSRSPDEMSGAEFEEYAALLFGENGIEVLEATKASGDFGADLIILYEGERTAVQCKRYSKPVGVKAVQEAAASMTHYGCTRAAVLTNTDYTRQARELALESGVILWNGDDLKSLEASANGRFSKRKTAALRVHRLETGKFSDETLFLSVGKQTYELPPHSVTTVNVPLGRFKAILHAGGGKASVYFTAGEEGFAAAAGFSGRRPFLAEISCRK